MGTSQRSHTYQTLRGEPVFHLQLENAPLCPLSCSSSKRDATADACLPLWAVSPSPGPASSISKFDLLSAHFPPWPVLPRGRQHLSPARRRPPSLSPLPPLSPASVSTRQPERSLEVERQMTPFLSVKPSNALGIKTQTLAEPTGSHTIRVQRSPPHGASASWAFIQLLKCPRVFLPRDFANPAPSVERSFPALPWQVSAHPSGHILQSHTPGVSPKDRAGSVSPGPG